MTLVKSLAGLYADHPVGALQSLRAVEAFLSQLGIAKRAGSTRITARLVVRLILSRLAESAQRFVSWCGVSNWTRTAIRGQIIGLFSSGTSLAAT